MFCMLLRKHLSGGKITAVRQIDFERIIVLDIESYDELGDLTTKHLTAELMGRHSNLILTDHQDFLQKRNAGSKKSDQRCFQI